MYDELIKRLRDCTSEQNGEKTLWCQAADAIDELSKKRVGTWHRIKASGRGYSFICNSCGMMYPYLTKCCPFCGVEYIDEEPPKE